MKNSLYYPQVSLSDEQIFTEIKKERDDIGYYSLPYVDTTNLKARLDSLSFSQKQIAQLSLLKYLILQRDRKCYLVMIRFI